MSGAQPSTMPDLCNRRRQYTVDLAVVLLGRLGIDWSQILMRAVGPFANYRGEIQKQDPKPGERIGGDTEISLDVGSNGVVDLVPYQLFYGLPGVSASGSETWEDRARSLMSPFDAATIRADMQLRSLARCYNGGLVTHEHVQRLLKLFGLPDQLEQLSHFQANLWLTLAPSANEWTGNPAGVERVLELLFGMPFEISENVQSRVEIPEAIRSQLGRRYSTVGEDFVIGAEMADAESAYEVVVHDVEPRDVPDWLPGGGKRRELDRTLGICMPEQLEAMITVRVSRTSVHVGRDAAEAYLGVSTYAMAADARS